MSFPHMDIVGQRFGRLVALDRVPKTREGREPTYWKCTCDCGNTHVTRLASLRSGVAKSCGCWRKEQAAKSAVRRFTTHGLHDSPEYLAWAAMKQRCYNRRCPEFKRYGARGIRVCEVWRHSFATFVEAVGRRPSPAHSIDRFPNNDGHYEPGNVRWATMEQQANNRRPKGSASHDVHPVTP